MSASQQHSDKDITNYYLQNDFTFFIFFVLKLTCKVGFITVPVMDRDTVGAGGGYHMFKP